MPSPSCNTKSPRGINTCESLVTTQIKMSNLDDLRSSVKETPIKSLLALTFPSTILTRPFAKLSILDADGNCNIRKISFAASNSGLITMSIPISCCNKSSCKEYSGFQTRAMVSLTPSFLPIIQQSILISSELVTAMSISAFWIFALINTS